MDCNYDVYVMQSNLFSFRLYPVDKNRLDAGGEFEVELTEGQPQSDKKTN